MFRLICVTVNIQYILLWFECRHGDHCATGQCDRQYIALQLTHQSDAASNRSHPAIFWYRLAAPDCVMKCIEVRAVR